jgi:hypothetical protein
MRRCRSNAPSSIMMSSGGGAVRHTPHLPLPTSRLGFFSGVSVVLTIFLFLFIDLSIFLFQQRRYHHLRCAHFVVCFNRNNCSPTTDIVLTDGATANAADACNVNRIKSMFVRSFVDSSHFFYSVFAVLCQTPECKYGQILQMIILIGEYTNFCRAQNVTSPSVIPPNAVRRRIDSLSSFIRSTTFDRI